jgi:hypothetical protein
MWTRIVLFSTATLAMGCRDSLEGTWEGDFECQGVDYDIEAVFNEGATFEYSGEMVFAYDEQTTFSGDDVVFSAQLEYDFSTEQTKILGGQDIYLDMTWTKLYCEIEYPDGEVVEGGCKNVGGIDDSDKGEPVGMVPMRFSGYDRLTIDDDNCKGTLYLDL